MAKKYLSSLSDLTDPQINERCEEIHLEVSRNPERYPRYAECTQSYQEVRTHLEALHPESLMEIDDLITSIVLRYAELLPFIYKQGARDCASMLHALFPQDKIKKEETT